MFLVCTEDKPEAFNSKLTLYQRLYYTSQENERSFVTVAGISLMRLPAKAVTVVPCSMNLDRIGHKSCIAIQDLKPDTGTVLRNLMIIDTIVEVQTVECLFV